MIISKTNKFSVSKWLFVPLMAGVMMVFFVYLPFDYRFSLSPFGFALCPPYTPHSTEDAKELFDNSLYMHPLLLEFLHLVSLSPTFLLLMDRDVLGCYTNSTLCPDLIHKTSFHFATSTDYALCLPDTREHRPIWDRWMESGRIVYRHINNVSITVSLFSDRKDYWLFHSLNGHPHAIPKIKLSTLFFSPSQQTEIPGDIPKFHWLMERGRFLSCNQTIAGEFRQKYDSTVYASPPLINDTAISDLAYFRNILLQFNMTPILFGGTLLGWYRECGIIPYTTDLDLMSLASEYTPKLIEKLKWNGRLKLYWLLGKPEDSLELSVFANGVKIDLFFMYPEENSSWVGGMIVYKRVKLRWTYPKLDEVCTADLNGYLFFVPCQVEKFLEADYGPKWFIPHHDAKFVWYKSHHNVKTVGKWPMKEWRKVYRTRF